MNTTLFNWGSVAVIVGGYLIGFYFQNQRINHLRDTMDSRFPNLKDFIKAETSRLEDRIKVETSRLDDRIGRLEHPVTKP